MDEKEMTSGAGEESKIELKINLIEDSDNAERHDASDSGRYHSHHSHHGHHHHSSHGRHKHHRHHKHHRRHSHSSSQKSGTKKFAAFLKDHRSIIINAVSCTVSIILLVLLALNFEGIENKSDSKNTSTNITTIKVESTIFVDEVPLVKQAILTYLDDANDRNANSVYKLYGGYDAKLNVGLPIEYTYRISGLPSGITLHKATLQVGLDENFGDARTYTFEDGSESVAIYHLLPGSQYYYKLNILLSSGTALSTTGSFKTAVSPRILSIDGIVNVRDIGGWETTSGQTIQYGLLYRGSELDGGVEPTYLLTDKGRYDMISTLGIRYDLDLRVASDNKGYALGANVVHENYAIGMYSDIFNGGNPALVRSIFAELANKDNYPIYLHCTYGRDRTGTICYLLEALLGVSDNDLRRDNELSAFTDSYVNSVDFAVFVDRINSQYEGNTTQEKVEVYLKSIGVTDAEIASIREIFLVD